MNDVAATSAGNSKDALFESYDEDRIRNHPVIVRLNHLNELSEKLQSDVESNVKSLKLQMANIIKLSNMVAKNNNEKDKKHLNKQKK